MDFRVLQAKDGPFFSNLPPKWAGFLRGLVLAVAAAAVSAAVKFLESGQLTPEGLSIYIPIAIVLLRTIEGMLDQRSQDKTAEVKAELERPA